MAVLRSGRKKEESIGEGEEMKAFYKAQNGVLEGEGTASFLVLSLGMVPGLQSWNKPIQETPSSTGSWMFGYLTGDSTEVQNGTQLQLRPPS